MQRREFLKLMGASAGALAAAYPTLAQDGSMDMGTPVPGAPEPTPPVVDMADGGRDG